MTDGKISSVPISEIHSEEGAQDLVRSERMKPYLAFLKAQMSGQDTEPYLAALAALPLEERYVWRVSRQVEQSSAIPVSKETSQPEKPALEAQLQSVKKPVIRPVKGMIFGDRPL